MEKVVRALMSVTDKSGLADFAQGLLEFGVEIISTGGTAKLLRDAGIKAAEISHYTGSPEILGGRVKTLHPRIHGGILYRRGDAKDVEQVSAMDIPAIDMVVVNLYQFRKAIERTGIKLDEAIEQIDIGGPTLLRAAAKNFRYVTVVCDPGDYGRILEEMRARNGATSVSTRFALAKKVFELTSSYDQGICDYLRGQSV